MKVLVQALRTLTVLTVLTGVLYPLGVTAIARLFFRHQAGGSLVWRRGHPVGSELLGQTFAAAGHVGSRPSACDYVTLPSGASNLPPSSQALAKAVAARARRLRTAHGWDPGAALPEDLLHASASGLDPHLSPAAARLQAARVATACGIATADVERLIADCTAGPQLGVFGPPRVNVLRLNLALEEAAATRR